MVYVCLFFICWFLVFGRQDGRCRGLGIPRVPRGRALAMGSVDWVIRPIAVRRVLCLSVRFRRTRTLLKEKEVPGYDRSMYTCERTVAKARDGVEVR